MLRQNTIKSRKARGQAIIEFTFAMIVVLLMFYGAVMVFRWAGLDLAMRQESHQKILTQGVREDWGGCSVPVFGTCPENAVIPFYAGPISQIDPYFHQPIKMNAVWGGY